MDERIWSLMREHTLQTIHELADEDVAVALKQVVELAQERHTTHLLFPKGGVRNYAGFTRVDLEARCEVERFAKRSSQRIMLWRPEVQG